MSIIKRILGTAMPQSQEFSKKEIELPKGEFVETRARGKITKVHPNGYGFISSKDIPFTRIFFHWSGLKPTTRNFTDLSVGLWVEFNPYKIEGRGYRAIQIEVIDAPE